MSLIERRTLKQVTILPGIKAANVQWVNQILRGDVVISETFERKGYGSDQVSEFMAEVEGAESYVAALGWAMPSSDDAT